MRSVAFAAFLLATSSLSAQAASTAAPVTIGFLTTTPQPNCAKSPCYVPYSSSNPVPVAIISGGGSGGTASAFGSAFPAQGTAAGAEYLSSPPTFVSGNMVPLQTDVNGNLKVTGSLGSNASVGATGSAVPASGTYIGLNNGGNLIGAVGDASGRQIVAGAGTAGTATGGVLTVQGVAGGTAQPVSESGTWTVQPGNTANTTAWLVTGTGGTFPATQSGTWNVNNISGTISLPTGAATSANQPTNSAIGATTSGQTGNLMMGAVTTSAPTYTTGQTNPISLDTTGAIRVNIVAGGGSGGTSSSFSATFPSTGTAAGAEYLSSPPTLTTGQMVALQVTSAGSLHATVDNTITAIAPADAITTGTYASGSPTLGAELLFNGTTYDRHRSGGVTGAAMVAGAAAGGTAIASAGNPVATAALGSTSDQTAVSNGQTVVPEATPNGKLVVQPWALTPNLADGGGSSTGTGTFTVLAASGSASLKEYMTSLQCGRSDAGTTAITVAISDGTKTRTFVVPDNGGGGGNNGHFVTPIVFAANTAVTAAFSAGVTTGYCNAEGYYAP